VRSSCGYQATNNTPGIMGIYSISLKSQTPNQPCPLPFVFSLSCASHTHYDRAGSCLLVFVSNPKRRGKSRPLSSLTPLLGLSSLHQRCRHFAHKRQHLSARDSHGLRTPHKAGLAVRRRQHVYAGESFGTAGGGEAPRLECSSQMTRRCHVNLQTKN